MIKKFLLVVLCSGIFSIGTSQNSVNDYSFVVVPEIYEFLTEKDQFQLNSLTKFLFNKHGFNAFFASELPNVKRCDGLYADVLGKPGFIYTKLTVVIRDCYGTEIFRSEEGKSKYKEFRKAFHESLRNAFISVEALQASQKDPDVYDDFVQDQQGEKYPVINEMQRPPANVDDQTSEMTVSTGSKIGTVNPVVVLPEEKFTSYSANNKTYLLRKTASGYSFYEESETSDTGLILLGKIVDANTTPAYISNEGETFKVSLDDNGSLLLSNDSKTVLYVRTVQ